MIFTIRKPPRIDSWILIQCCRTNFHCTTNVLIGEQIGLGHGFCNWLSQQTKFVYTDPATREVPYIDDSACFHLLTDLGSHLNTVKYFIFVGFNFRRFLKINRFVGLWIRGFDCLNKILKICLWTKLKWHFHSFFPQSPVDDLFVPCQLR